MRRAVTRNINFHVGDIFHSRSKEPLPLRIASRRHTTTFNINAFSKNIKASICTYLKYMSHLFDIPEKQTVEESKPEIFTFRATRPSCCIHLTHEKTKLILFPGEQNMEAMFDLHINSKMLQRDRTSFHFFLFLLRSLKMETYQGSWNDLVYFGRIGIISFKILLPVKDIPRSRRTRKKNSMFAIF